MTLRRSLRLCGAAAAAALLLAGCGGDDEDAPTEPDQAIPAPEHEADDTVRLPLGLVSPQGHSVNAPIDEEGVVRIREDVGSVQQTEVYRTDTFGCEDTVSVIASVPMVTEDPARSAVEFLLQDQHYHHGDPAYLNPLAISEGLELDSVTVDDDVVTVDLTGEPTVRGACESWQIHSQLEATARAATGAEEAEILLDGEPFAHVLGIEVTEGPLTLQRVTDIIR
ncbi:MULTISPECIES: GerMN domain-containing protein [unclassified Nesterenkonia]|uniref:GerMN domain-containing protein n=1 Tax=unclassified Nesterenkonia TaxID=2629769 RepID=UPI000872BDC7|nr:MULTISPECIES: GerMN domain-containing protein [unclassified Nesterenkonia]MDS2173061.1 GerMN domain-containing protein [Nesterenkonia sp. CL21]